MTDPLMSAAEIEAAILSDVVVRFVNLKASTRRHDLIVKYRDSDVLMGLANRMILRRKHAGTGEEYLPTAAAFQFSGNSHLRETAKLGLTVVLHALQNMGVGEPKEVGYSFDDLKRHVHELFPDRLLDDETLKLGLYLAQDFGVLAGFRFDAPSDTEIVWFQVGESAITKKNLDDQWDIVTATYQRSIESLYASGDREEIEKALQMGGQAEWEEISPLGEGGQSTVFLVRRPNRVEERRNSIKTISSPPWTTQATAEQRLKMMGAFAEAVLGFARPEKISELGARKVFKVPPEGATLTPEQHRAIERLKNEIAVLSQSRRGLPQLLDADIAKRQIVTEYFEEGTLEKQPLRYRGQVLRALKAFRSLVETVSDIHKDGYVHRDIKPANVFIRKDDELVLGDFGIVFIPGHPERVTFSDERVGPRDYMPQWGDVGERLENVQADFDVYMLGKLLWCMVSGNHKLPREYHRRPAYDLAKQFPNDQGISIVNEILDRCVVEEPHHCLKSAQDLLEIVDQSLDALGSGLPMLDRKGKMSLPCRMCGKGFYQEHTTARLPTETHPILLRVFVCNVCTHYEFFAPGNPDEAAQRGWKPWRTN
jgi:serine/threonine protein kinase